MNDNPPASPPEPPRAHNVAALDKLIKQISGAILADMERRKWCVEQAIALLKEADAVSTEIINPMTFAQQIYDFVTKPAADAAGEKPSPPSAAERFAAIGEALDRRGLPGFNK